MIGAARTEALVACFRSCGRIFFHLHTVLKCHQHRKDKEGSRCQNKDGSSTVENSHTKDLTGTDQLTDDTDAGKPNGKSKSHTDSVKQRTNWPILGCISLCTSQDNTVNYDQRNIDSQRIVKARNKSL